MQRAGGGAHCSVVLPSGRVHEAVAEPATGVAVGLRAVLGDVMVVIWLTFRRGPKAVSFSLTTTTSSMEKTSTPSGLMSHE